MDFFSYPSFSGARWTRIDKRLVDSQVLTAAEETFDETEDGLIVHRVLRRGEIRRWAEKTREIRNQNDESTAVGRLRASMFDDGDRSGDRDYRARRRDSRGKDTEQERLERLLDGDMKSDVRHFADTDDDTRT